MKVYHDGSFSYDFGGLSDGSESVLSAFVCPPPPLPPPPLGPCWPAHSGSSEKSGRQENRWAEVATARRLMVKSKNLTAFVLPPLSLLTFFPFLALPHAIPSHSTVPSLFLIL